MPPDSVGKCPPGFSEEVLDRAMDAAYADSRWSNGHLYPEGWADFEDGLKLAAPVIAEAAYRAGIEAGCELLLEAIGDEEEIAMYTEDDRIATVFRARAKMLRGVRSALAALTDTEGRDE